MSSDGLSARGRLTQALVLMWKPVVIVLAYAWALLAGAVLVYYGSYVFRTPINPLGAEARLGAWLGFIYGMPASVVLGAGAWRVRSQRSALAVLLVLPPVFAVAYFACLCAVVWHAGSA